MREGGGMRGGGRALVVPLAFLLLVINPLSVLFKQLRGGLFFWPVLVIYSSESKLAPPCFQTQKDKADFFFSGD